MDWTQDRGTEHRIKLWTEHRIEGLNTEYKVMDGTQDRGTEHRIKLWTEHRIEGLDTE